MEPNLYLLDAPTSHPDLSRIGLLQRWLPSLLRDAGVNFTCNDCTFLAELTKSTLFLRETASRLLRFSPARAEQLRMQAAKQKIWASLQALTSC